MSAFALATAGAGAPSPRHRSAGRVTAIPFLAALGCLSLIGCSQMAVESGEAGFVSQLALADDPLQIGVLEGDDDYVFATINNVVRLDDGSFAVADGLTQRISIYDESGDFVRSWGQKGDGPGEFDNLAGVIPLGSDSLVGAETFRDQLTVFDLHGNPGRTLSAIELSNDSTFRLDSWLHGRYWVRGPITPEERARAREALDRHTPPTGSPGMRVAIAGTDGSMWIPEPVPGGMAAGSWTRLSPTGTPDASLQVPWGFRPTHFEDDRVTGVWRDENDVSFVRSYAMQSSDMESRLPDWLADGPAAGRYVLDADEEADVMDQMRTAIRGLASAQEIHYSSAMSYTSDISELSDLELPEGIHVTFTKGDSRGWTAVFAHDGLSRICGLGYGFDLPAGWMPGRMHCAPRTEEVGS